MRLMYLSIVFVYACNEQSENEFKKTILFKITTKNKIIRNKLNEDI